MAPVLLGACTPACHIPRVADEDKSPDVNPPKGPKVTEGVENHKPAKPREIGGPKGPEPTRYGDWEVGGRCTDF